MYVVYVCSVCMYICIYVCMYVCTLDYLYTNYLILNVIIDSYIHTIHTYNTYVHTHTYIHSYTHIFPQSIGEPSSGYCGGIFRRCFDHPAGRIEDPNDDGQGVYVCMYVCYMYVCMYVCVNM